MSRTLGSQQHSQGFRNFATSNYRPSSGARVLTVTNLRRKPTSDRNEHYTRIWNQLDGCLTDIFAGREPQQSLELLYRGVQDTCRQGDADRLFGKLRDRCETHLKTGVLPTIEFDSRFSNDDVLRRVYACWQEFYKQILLIRSIFYYLDRSFLLNSKDHPELNDMSMSQFRRMIFVAADKESSSNSLGARVLEGICELVDLDRAERKERFSPVLLKNSVSMLHIFGIYTKSFEPRLIRNSREYFESFARERSSAPLRDYIAACDKLLRLEELRCDTYNFDSSTKKALLHEAQRALVEQRSAILLNEEAVGRLIDANDIVSLKALYELLKLTRIQKELREPWEAYTRQTGSAIVVEKEKVDGMVIRLLELKKALDIIIRDAFGNDETFAFGLRQAFGTFINDRRTASAWGTSNSKVGEMIAKYIDTLLRGGLKAVPRSLASDAVDRELAEKRGQGSTGDEDAELDRQLDQGLELFRFIEGKDVFEAFYKRDLARRLLMGRSASQDAERNMLSKLKAECGSIFTHNLETMFKDQELAREEMISYKQSLSSASNTTLDLQVQVLSLAAWPTYPDVTVNLPAEVANQIEKYDRHYKGHHQGRRLTWKHSLAHCTVKARFQKGIKELVVSGFQAIVLLLFNDIPDSGHLSYKDIAAATGLDDAELVRTLQSLACAKLRVLTKHPKGRDVNPTDTFTVNTAFHDPKFRIKINTVQLKETKEENQATHEKVAQDRKFETQAAIVRIMKGRKTMTHTNLVSEVIDQTKSRGAVEVSDIKKNIEKLIEKDYIERNEDSTYSYLA